MNQAFNAQSFSQWMQHKVSHTETVLESVLPQAASLPERLHQAMRYSVLGGGKRVRACLVYAAGEASLAKTNIDSARQAALDLAAAAVELVHAYSLVHDDLPCMDNDTLRRGKPTVHVQFDEATAMLVGDALQPLAFSLLAKMPVAPALVVQAIQILGNAIGSTGMVGGQAIDCENVGNNLSLDSLQQMHSMKTGALLRASVLLGGVVAGASSPTRKSLEEYAQPMGLGFQVMDDILDVTSSTATLGKKVGQDAAYGKPTYVSLLGLEPSKALLESLLQQARDAILPLGSAAISLYGMANFIVQRQN